MRLLVIGGSDAGVEAGLQAAARGAEVELLVADAYPNFSVCGIPYYLSGEVPDWRALAHPSRSRCTPDAESNRRRPTVAGRRVS